MAIPKLTGKNKLIADLNTQKTLVKRAQDELNVIGPNGKPLTPGSTAYIAANQKFLDAIAKRDAIQLALDNYVEPAKPKSAKQLEAERQKAAIEGTIPPTGGTISVDPNTGQVLVPEDFKGMLKTAENFLRKDLTGPGRLLLATELKNAGFEVPEIEAFNQQLLAAYRNAITAAQAENKRYPEDVRTLNDFLIQQTIIRNQIKALGDGSELPKPTGQQEIYNRSTAEGVIDSIFDSLNLGREASKSEIDTLYKQLQAEQKKTSSMSKNSYKMVGGRRVLVQESGLDARTFLENKVKELPAYKDSQTAKSEKNKISLASTALANGYNLETDFANDLPNWLEAINNGKSLDEFKNKIRTSARRILPEAVRSQIDPEEDLSTVFSTYLSNVAKARGIPINAVNLNETINMAITDKGFANSKEFDVKKRSQVWWDSSPEGISVTTNVLNDTLKDFGMLGQGVRTV